MTTPEEFLSRHPNASRKQIMKACGVSARVARRAEPQQEEAKGQRRSYWARAATLLALGTAGLCAAWLWNPEAETQAAKSQDAAVDNRAEITELYAALDRKDREALPVAVAKLESEDPQLRLASLRVIAKLDPDPHAVGILALTTDSDARVRRAAIQLAGRLKHDRAAKDLVALAVDGQRPLS